jgi:hypothetical protein
MSRSIIRLLLAVSTSIALLNACGGSDYDRSEENKREAWVAVDRVHRRTCPSTNCGSVGTLFRGEKSPVLEERDGWVRVTRYYDASCKNGRSEYVDSGNTACDSTNGIVDGRFAEWVSVSHLISTRPADPAAGAAGNFALVSGSDDYGKYKDAFVRAAADLIKSGRCSQVDFQESGGWLKSIQHQNRPVYFTNCGGMTLQNRLYLDASTGRIFR